MNGDAGIVGAGTVVFTTNAPADITPEQCAHFARRTIFRMTRRRARLGGMTSPSLSNGHVRRHCANANRIRERDRQNQGDGRQA